MGHAQLWEGLVAPANTPLPLSLNRVFESTSVSPHAVWSGVSARLSVELRSLPGWQLQPVETQMDDKYKQMSESKRRLSPKEKNEALNNALSKWSQMCKAAELLTVRFRPQTRMRAARTTTPVLLWNWRLWRYFLFLVGAVWIPWELRIQQYATNSQSTLIMQHILLLYRYYIHEIPN